MYILLSWINNSSECTWQEIALTMMETTPTTFLTGTIKKRALGFPTSLKTVTPPKGSYISTSVGVQYFVFNDHKEVCFVTNVFPESMNGKVYRLQHDGRLREQSVPPPLPVYNKYMCIVNREILTRVKQSNPGMP